MPGPAESGRILGVDFGERRIGVALSDPTATVASPLSVVERVGPRKDANAIGRLVEREGVVTVVVGLPRTLDGDERRSAEEARAFADRIRRRLPGLPVHLWDERLTTAQAEREMIADGARRSRRRQRVDAVAATLILQSWLDARGS